MSTATLDQPILAPTAIRLARRPVRAATQARGSRPARPAVRLTRRGRLVLLSLVALVALAMIVIGAASVSASTSAPSAPRPVAHVVVQPGQTLWELAEQVAPGKDPREVIRRISDLNALTSPVVSPGQSLAIPAF